MFWHWSPSVLAEVAASAGLILIAIYFPWRDLNRRAGFFGSSLLLTCAVWVLSHALEIGLPDPLYKSYLMGAQLIWGTIAVTFWLLYIVHFIGPKKWLTTRIYVLFGIIPLLEILGVGTNSLHGLFWSKPGLDANNPYLPLDPAYGMIYWICMVYVFLLTLAGSLLLMRNVVRRHHGHAKESGGLVVAAALPMLAAIIETLGLTDSWKLSIGITPWASFTGALILVWYLPRFHLHDVIPFARDNVFERIEDNIIVLDKWDRVIDLNPAAERLLDHRISDVLGFAIKRIFPQWPDPVGLTTAPPEIESREEIVLNRGGEQRTYNLSVSIAAEPEGGSVSKVVLLTDITYRKKAEEERKHHAEKLLNALTSTIETISKITEIRDPYTAGHQKRVAQLAVAIAGELGFSKDQAEAVYFASVIHDIGKMNIPAEILSKPGPLSKIEFEMLKQHAQASFDILKNIDFPWPIAQIVIQHHERTNGSGYPSGLSGEAILIEARILAVADVVEAMASNRPYRSALGIDKALEEIRRNRGAFYDPAAVGACLRLFTEKGFRLKD